MQNFCEIIILLFVLKRTDGCQSSNTLSGQHELASTPTDTGNQIGALKTILGGDFRDGGTGRITPFQSGASGNPASCPSEISCQQFDNRCRWTNAPSPPDQVGDFVTAQGQAAPNRWALITGSSLYPTGQWLLVGSPRRSAATDNAQFFSDPIKCQSGEGILGLDYWVSPDTALDVCIRQPPSDPTLRNCQTIGAGRDAQLGKRVTVSVGGSREPFSIVLVAKGFTHEDPDASGGLVAVNRLSYTASDCDSRCGSPSQSGGQSGVFSSSVSSTSTTTYPGQTTTTTSFRNGQQQLALPQFCRDVVCNFDDPSSSCIGASQRSNWLLSDKVVGIVGNPLTGIRSDGSHGGFAYAPTAGGASYVTPQFNMPQDGRLQFIFYRATAGSNLFICDNLPAGNGGCTAESATWKTQPVRVTDRRWRPSSSETNDVYLQQGPHKLTFSTTEGQHGNGYIGLDNVNIVKVDGTSFC